MNYVFDNSPLSALFRNFYRKTFRTLWERFDALVADSSIVSTREALREIKGGGPESLLEWVEQHQALFATPTAEEGRFVATIYRVPHFQQNIEQQKSGAYRLRNSWRKRDGNSECHREREDRAIRRNLFLTGHGRNRA